MFEAVLVIVPLFVYCINAKIPKEKIIFEEPNLPKNSDIEYYRDIPLNKDTSLFNYIINTNSYYNYRNSGIENLHASILEDSTFEQVYTIILIILFQLCNQIQIHNLN